MTNPSEYPEGKIAEVREPVVRATILSPADYIGTIMELCQSRRGSLQGMDYLSEDRVEMRYTLPLAEIVFDFFDQLKSRTKGYASLDYEPTGEQAADLVKVDILLQGEPVDAFSAIVHRDAAYSYGVMLAGKLKDLIPRQQFEVPIQAAIGARVIARENIRAIRKDVLAKCYGGDITRKRKLLEKQKEGKKRMKMVGRVEVPQEAFIAALSNAPTGEKAQEVGACPVCPVRSPPGWTRSDTSAPTGPPGWTGCPRLAAEVVDEWSLTYDGPLWHGFCSLVAPVRTEDGTPRRPEDRASTATTSPSRGASPSSTGTATAPSACSAPTRTGARCCSSGCTARTSPALWDLEACEIVAGLYPRLHVPALPQLRTVTSYVDRLARPRSPTLPARRADPAPAGRAGALPRARPGRRPGEHRRDRARRPALRERAGRRPGAVAGDRPEADVR